MKHEFWITKDGFNAASQPRMLHTKYYFFKIDRLQVLRDNDHTAFEFVMKAKYMAG